MPKDDLYQILGIDNNASKAEIKKSYRKASKKSHPDMQGGSDKKFALVEKSFDILSDDERRVKYDSTGDDSEKSPDNEHSTVINFIAFSLATVLAECAQNGKSPLEIDIVKSVITKINSSISEAQKNIRITKNILDFDKKLLGRFSSDKDNIFENIIRHRISDMKNSIFKMEDVIKNGNLATDIIKEVKFKKDDTQYESSGDRMINSLGSFYV